MFSAPMNDTISLNFGPLREHQARAVDVARDIAAGGDLGRAVTAAVTPGGGKSLLASVFAHVLLGAGAVDGVCIACPRDSLRHQMRESFTVPERNLHRRLLIDDNRRLAQRSLFGEAGAVTTYQAIACAPEENRRRFERERFLLVLDEPHHLSDDGHAAWVTAVRPLVQRAAVTLAMSGTLFRHDRKAIPFIAYDADRQPIVDIRYTRRHALAEHAILPIEVTLSDGHVEYTMGQARQICELSSAPQEEEARALRAVLSDSRYRDALVRTGLRAWSNYRHDCYPSRALIVCHNQEAARHAAELVAREFTREVALAISDERDAQFVLAEFRAGRGQVLVTVGMAAEGFDAVDISHLVCLSDIRSVPWLDQCFARATRMSYACGVPWEEQRAHLFVPNDHAMVRYFNTALAEQDEHFAEQSERPTAASECTGRQSGLTRNEDVSATATIDRFGDTEDVLTADESATVARLRKAFPQLARVDARDVARLGGAITWDRLGEAV